MSDVDDKLAAAWRAASREEPPAALDDALRAAARRAVKSAPSRARHMQSWPLAAAAVVAVLAIGIVHMAPPEQVTPALVADSASRETAVKEKDALPPPAAPSATPAPAMTNATPSVSAQLPASAPIPAPAPVDRLTSTVRKQLAQSANVQSADGQQTNSPSSNAMLAQADKPQATASAAGGSAAGAVAQSQARENAVLTSKLEAGATIDTMKKSRAEPFPAAPAEAKIAADTAAVMSPPPAAAAPMALAKAAPERERAKDAAPRTPEEWIKLIRRLQGEGRKEDVAKELAAFRAEYKERADALLPVDLREMK